jgi:hypothetical protein
MSHFAVGVILPKNFSLNSSREIIEQYLTGAMAPFDENLEAEEREEDCWCSGQKAELEARESAKKTIGKSIEDYREEFHKRPEAERTDENWKVLIKPLLDAEAKALEAHPLKGKPAPDCEECEGKGTRRTTYNQDSQWDWYQVGGRWTGLLDGYDPEKDPANLKTCYLCSGTGIRPDGKEQFGEDWFKSTNGCNGCQGKGKSVAWPTSWEARPADYRYPIRDLHFKEREKHGFFALLTPEGEWIAEGSMGWWGMVSDQKKCWDEIEERVLLKYQDHLVTIVDCHI